MLKIFTLCNTIIICTLSGHTQTSACPSIPEMNTTSILSYVRLPADSAPNNIRFFYRYTTDCNSPAVVNDLAIADLRSPASIEWDLNFQKDSSVNVTGVIDP